MLLFQAQSEKQGAQATNAWALPPILKGFMKEKRALVGLKIIEEECKARGLSKEKTDEIKKNYKECVNIFLKRLADKGIGKPKNQKQQPLGIWAEMPARQQLLDIWTEVSSTLWSPDFFEYKPSGTLSECFDYGRGKFMDCDTSSFFIADVFSQLGIDSKIVYMPKHVILKVEELNGKALSHPLYFETTTHDKTQLSGTVLGVNFSLSVNMRSYSSASQVIKNCGALYAEIPFSDPALLAIQKGFAFGMAGNYRSAIASMSQALGSYPKNTLIYITRASYFGHLKEYGKAMSDYETALKLDPGSAEAYESRGIMQEGLGKKSLAAEDYMQAAIRYISRSRASGALKACESGLNMDPGNPQLYYLRGKANTMIKKYDLALKDVSKAISLDPKKSQYYAARSEIYEKLGDKANADSDKIQALLLKSKETSK